MTQTPTGGKIPVGVPSPAGRLDKNPTVSFGVIVPVISPGNRPGPLQIWPPCRV